MDGQRDADVVVIGAGLAGATVATVLSGSGLEVTILDGGMRLSPRFAQHITSDRRVAFGTPLRDRLVAALLQSVPNVAAADCHRHAALAVASPSGGASVLWTGIAHRLDTPTESGPAFAQCCLDPFYAEAEALLGVREGVSIQGVSRRPEGPRLVPLRVARAGGRDDMVAGPAEILMQARGPRPRLLLEHVAVRIEHRGGAVTAITAGDLSTGGRRHIRGAAYVIAADALRSPALLAASGLGPEPGFPVGRWLADHPLAVARVAATTAHGRALAADLLRGSGPVRGVRCLDAPSGVHALILAGAPAQDVPVLHLFWYALGHPRETNSIAFSPDDASGFGLFGARTIFREHVSEPRLLDAMMDHLEGMAARFGRPCPGWQPRLLPLGAALHAFGTMRTAAAGQGVTDDDGRVQGFSNLYAAGAGRIPSPCSVNPALAVVAMAIATGRAITDQAPARQGACRGADGRTARTD